MTKCLEIHALPDFPMVQPEDDLTAFVLDGIAAAGLTLETGDVLIAA
ncbi:MAG: hypothetical protein HQ511_10485, partial [Rhodospirillales bacterium]|nr:hypothetical protein [Rhodospirillales bacterium]